MIKIVCCFYLLFCCRCTALVRVLPRGRTAPLLSMAVAEAAAAVVCEPGSRSTDQATREAVLQVLHRVQGLFNSRISPLLFPTNRWLAI